MDAWMSIMGLKDPLEENEVMFWGQALEPVMAKRYSDDTGNLLFPCPELGLDHTRPIIHPTIPWWGGTADRLVIDDPKLQTKNIDKAYKLMAKKGFWDHVHGIWEGKTAGSRMKKTWDDGQIPPSYYLQVAWYLPVYRAQWGDISVLIGGQDWRTMTIRRDLELEAVLEAKAREFMEQYVVTNTPPPVDGTEGWSAYLAQLFPKEQENMVAANTQADDLMTVLRDVREHQRTLSLQEAQIINELKLLIGDHTGLKAPDWQVTWKCNRDTVKTDWNKAFRALFELAVSEGWDSKAHDIVEANSKLVPGARVFRPTFPKEEE
jgi:predicted phage-related endonuclease